MFSMVFALTVSPPVEMGARRQSASQWAHLDYCISFSRLIMVNYI